MTDHYLQAIQFARTHARASTENALSLVAYDWTAWTIDHPAYRRAVPHHLSFTRERKFDSQLLILTHEITHVLSMLGSIGTALTCLRVAAFDDEVTLWSLALADPAKAVERLASDGVAPLEENRAGLLVRAERALEVMLKARALQDAWTPWFEGLALYGELSADPVEDPAMIDLVNEALRNMVDVLRALPRSGRLTSLPGKSTAKTGRYQHHVGQ